METQWLEAPAEEPDCRTVYRHGKLCLGSDLGWLSVRLWGRHVHSLRRGWRLGAPVAVTTKLPLMPQELGLLPRSVSLGVGLKRTAARFCLAGSSVLPPCSRQERSLAFRCSRDGQASGDANCGSAVTWPSISGRSHWSAAHRWEAGLKIETLALGYAPTSTTDRRLGACRRSLQSCPRWMILDALSFSSSDAPFSVLARSAFLCC